MSTIAALGQTFGVEQRKLCHAQMQAPAQDTHVSGASTGQDPARQQYDRSPEHKLGEDHHLALAAAQLIEHGS